MILPCHRITVLLRLAVPLAVGVCLPTGPAWSQEPIRLHAKAPEGQSSFKYAFGGVFFVDKNLNDEYNRLLFRIRALKSDFEADRIGAAESLTELKDLQTRLDRLQKEIEKKKTFVPLGQVRKQSETLAFDLGPERLLVVTADHVCIEGWDGPQVKCVLERQLIVPDKTENTKADEQLRSMRLLHRHGPAPQSVGKTAAEREADEKKFLAGPKGRGVTGKEREFRHLVETKRGPLYQAFQGKDLDAITIEGLDEVEGNRRIEMEISGDHEQVTAGELQRHASLTVYVPQCKAVAVQACTTGLNVKGVHGDVLVDGGKWDVADWGGAVVHICDLYGSLTVVDLPVETLSLDSIHGSVHFLPAMISMFDGYSATSPGASYVGGQEGERLIPPRPMSVLRCKHIDGDFTASFMRRICTWKPSPARLT